MAPPTDEGRIPVAIIGMACRFPGDATSPSKFWDLLKQGRDAYSPNTDRWNSEAFHHPTGGRLNSLPTRGGHFLKEDPYVFDAAFFNITAAEAVAFDPKQRITMEVAYEALENAGLTLQRVAGTQTACYVGSSMSDYRDMLARDFNNYPKYYILGNGEEMIANRLSHFLDIHGPSVTVQTACSSSLVSTHLACQSIRTGEADMAIAAGVGLILTPDLTVQLNNLQALNPDGHSRSFDQDANGYARGEGAGVLVLKRLDKALRDGDPIRAVIRASGVNSDGWTQGVTLPSGEAQEALIRRIYGDEGLSFASTQYVEAHGTGTKAGDPIETGAISRTIGSGATKSRRLWIGSVKPNIGHLEAAAGVASIIKGVLAMENAMIPPNVHFTKPNPAIKLDEWNMAVPTRLTPWPVCKTKRMSINGFGIGGTNGHLVLESLDAAAARGAQQQPPEAPPARSRKRLLVFSSHDQAGFRRISDALAAHLDGLGPAAATNTFLARLAHTLATARAGLSWRATCFAESTAQLRRLLADDGLGHNATRAAASAPRLGFVFTGQGAQWAGMGVEMLDAFPVFRDSVARSAALLAAMGCDWHPVKELERPASESRLKSPAISQPICTVLQIALVDVLRSWGVAPRRVAGHSSGEIAAAYCAGILTHRDAIAIAYYRGKASAGLVGLHCGMMAVACSPDEAHTLLADHAALTGGRVTVACVNSPSSVTLSGDLGALDKLRALLEADKVFARLLQVDVAYHSAYMQGAVMEYSSAIADIEPREPAAHDAAARVTMVSSVTGDEVAPEMLSSYYWIRNLVSPVLFSQALKELVAPSTGGEHDGAAAVDMLIEVGPHSALGGPIEQILAHHRISNVGYRSVLTRLRSSLDTSLQLASDLFLHGVPLDVQAANGDAGCALLTNLPPYPWNHAKVFRCESRIARELLFQKFPTRSLLGAPVPMMDETQRVWRSFIRLDDEPWLRGHMVGSTVLFPGAGMMSCVLEAARQLVAPGKTARAFRIRDVSLPAAMALPEGAETEVIVHLRPCLASTLGSTTAAWWEFTMSSCVQGDELRDNCRGLLAVDYAEDTSEQMAREDASIEAARVADYHRIRSACPVACTKEQFYAQISKAAWNYTGAFQGVDACTVGDGHGTFAVRVHDIGETYTKGKLDRHFLIHAATLDAVFQALLSGTWKGGADGGFETNKPYVPVHIGELEVSATIPGDVGYVMPGFCLSRKFGFTDLSSDMVAFDTQLSRSVLVVKDFRVSELNMDTDAAARDGAGPVVDPTDITAVVQVNHALDMMTRDEIQQVVSAFPQHARLQEVVKMALHIQPAAKVLEVVADYDAISSSAISSLPEGCVASNNVRFAVAGHGDDTGVDKAFGQPFELDADCLLREDIASPDILVLSDRIGKLESLDTVLERATSFVKSEATVIVDGSTPAVAAVLGAKGFSLLASVEGEHSFAVYSSNKASEHANGTNGAPKQQAVILAPGSPTQATKDFSSSLQRSLGEHGFSIATKTVAELSASGEQLSVEGAILVSLLELEGPFLDDLSQTDFEAIKPLLLGYERLLWITHGDDPSLAVIDGLARCIGSEKAGTRFQVLHLSEATGISHGPSLATRIVTSKVSRDDEFQERDGLLQVARISRSTRENESIRHHLEDSTRVSAMEPSEDLRLSVGKPGLLDTLQFVQDDLNLAPLADHELDIQVKATGINFRDIMASMGLIPMSVLGLEASGVVLRAGAQAASVFKPGDRVSFMGIGTHATRFRAHYRVAARVPDHMSFEEAAALPVIYATAYHGLVNLARMRRGQSVLIHAAAGGVGQAAIQMARHLGLVIYATVGSPDKRKLLIDTYAIPDEHIFHSRDVSFAKGIMRVTGGRGVNCVLNSLSGELLRVSWECLAPWGTFIEIGLRDILDNTRLDMRPFSKSTTFTFLDLFRLYQEDPETLGTIFEEAFQLVNQGALRAPTPLTVHPVGEVGEAFKTMRQGKHRGKMVLSFADATATAPILRRAADALRLDPAATYLFVGGLGGLGRSQAREFVACGARNIAFLSRSGGASAEARALIDELAGRGARVEAYSADVADRESFRAAMARCEADLPPVRGVVQMAMVLRDTVFDNMSHDAWQTGLRPKVQGTRHLDEYFDASRPLDFFIICSSISGITGNPGQAQYCAGNTYQDALAHRRRARGLKAVSVNLGIMRDVGVLAEQGAVGNYKLWEETLGIRETTFHAFFKGLINRSRAADPAAWPPAQVITGLGTADIMAASSLEQPWYFSAPRFGPLAVATSSAAGAAAGAGRQGEASLASRLGEAGSREQAVEIIRDGLVGKVAEILQMPASEVDPGRPMYRYGVDSLVALEVRNWITREMKASVALLEVLAAVPMEVFARSIAEKSKLLSFEG